MSLGYGLFALMRRKECKVMNDQFETIQKFSKDGVDAAVKSMSVLTKGQQTILGETADFSKKSGEQIAAAFEKMKSIKSFDKFVELSLDFNKTFFNGFVAHATKIGDLSSALTKEAMKPYEGLAPKASKAA
jgi:hypothetical protein